MDFADLVNDSWLVIGWALERGEQPDASDLASALRRSARGDQPPPPADVLEYLAAVVDGSSARGAGRPSTSADRMRRWHDGLQMEVRLDYLAEKYKEAGHRAPETAAIEQVASEKNRTPAAIIKRRDRARKEFPVLQGLRTKI